MQTLEMTLGFIPGNSDNKAVVSSYGGKVSYYTIPSFVNPVNQHCHSPKAPKGIVSGSVELLVAGKVKGKFLVGGVAAEESRHNKTTSHRAGTTKIENVPHYIAALSAAIVPSHIDHVVYNIACSVLNASGKQEMLELLGKRYGVMSENRDVPLNITFNVIPEKVLPEGAACGFANDTVKDSVIMDCGHGTTIFAKRDGSPRPYYFEHENTGVSMLFEQLMQSKSVTKAADLMGHGSPKFAYIKMGILDGSYRYGGENGRHSFTKDFKVAVKQLIELYDEFFTQHYDPIKDSSKQLYMVGGGANIPQVAEFIRSKGGKLLTDDLSGNIDPMFIDARILHDLV